jgi:hypothetical protein
VRAISPFLPGVVACASVVSVARTRAAARPQTRRFLVRAGVRCAFMLAMSFLEKSFPRSATTEGKTTLETT